MADYVKGGLCCIILMELYYNIADAPGREEALARGCWKCLVKSSDRRQDH